MDDIDPDLLLAIQLSQQEMQSSEEDIQELPTDSPNQAIPEPTQPEHKEEPKITPVVSQQTPASLLVCIVSFLSSSLPFLCAEHVSGNSHIPS